MKHKIMLEGRQVAYSVRTSSRSKHVRIKVDPFDGVKVTLPVGSSTRADIILQENAAWVLKHIDRFADQIPQRTFTDGERIPFLGEDHTLALIFNANKSITTVKQIDSIIQVRLAEQWREASLQGHVKTVLEKWYRKQARTYLTERTAHFANIIGVQYQSISIKGQKTRWGSCSITGRLNYNWKLMLAPPDAIDYLVIHELCHLIEMNHDPAFWRLVELYCPNYAYWKKWLRDNAYRLQL